MADTVSFELAHRLLEEADVSLSEEQFVKLRKYVDLLISESGRQNVTAVRDPENIWKRHIADSAVLLHYLNDGSSVLDLGTGGGIPAIPLAILNPSLDVTMLDSELNKIQFCQNAVSALGLQSKCLCDRAEELAHDLQYRGQFDAVVSRAMAGGSMLSELSVPFLKRSGRLIAMKGRSFDDEVERFSPSAAVLHCCVEIHPYTLFNESKTLVILTKQEETDEKYPRRFAKIKRNPL